MTGKILLDTNVLVYIYARSDLRKQAIAEAIANVLIAPGQAVVSTQVLAEFFNTATRKLGLPPGIVQERLAHYEQVITRPLQGVSRASHCPAGWNKFQDGTALVGCRDLSRAQTP